MNSLRKLQSKLAKRRVLMPSAVLLVSVAIVGMFAPVAQAAELGLSFLGISNFGELMASGLANLANYILFIASYWVAFTGTLLNVSMSITLHIKEFVNSTPAIFDVWKAIRDISGLFIIFTLLYAAIRQILGISPPNFGNIIKNIVIAGVLINFSFFITGVLIDASNVVSLALYRAMLPGQPDAGKMIENCISSGQNVDNCGAQSQLVALTGAGLNDGGLSALFMQSLQLQSVYDPKNLNLAEDREVLNVLLKIILLSVTGVLIMVVAGLSFLAAAIAFIVRLVILVFLLAFSPIMFAASIVPGIDEYASDWRNMLKSQLIFMPAYLLLMYAALMILNKSTIFLNGTTGGWKGTSLQGAGALIPVDYMVFCINAVFVIILINIPLLAAIKLGGTATKFINAKKFGAQGVFGFAGAKTIGKGAMVADKYLAKTRIFGGTTLGRDIAAATTGKLKKSSFGSDWRSADEAKKADKESKAAMSSIQKTRALDNIANSHPFGLNNRPTAEKYDKIFKTLSTKEKLALGKERLLKPEVISRLKKSDFEAIDKSDEFSDDEKLQIKNKRKEVFETAIKATSIERVQRMMKEYEGKDLGGFSKEQYAQIVPHITEGQLKKIRDDGSIEDQDNIYAAIDIATRAGARVPKEKWIKNKREAGEWGTPPAAPAPAPAPAPGGGNPNEVSDLFRS